MANGIKFNRDGEARCKHSSFHVCDECFNKTPGLIAVYGLHYRATPELISYFDSQSSSDGVSMSPGTRTD